MAGKIIPLLAFVLVLTLPALSAERGCGVIFIDPAKAAQLKRLEPLNDAKIDVFVESGQLTRAQAELVRYCIDRSGKLNLPDSNIALEPPRRRAPPSPPARIASAPDDGLGLEDRDRLMALIKSLRHGDNAEIGGELRKFRPASNKLIAASYPNPIDLPLKIALWEKVAGPANPQAAEGLCETHAALIKLARPVLVPFAKDIGGAMLQRSGSDPTYPSHRYFTSRELRDMIIQVEGLIARCPGATAAVFLASVYMERYGEGEAPMRDDGRDWRRMIEVCGGDPKHFDDGDAKTWETHLSPAERTVIAEHLLPYLHQPNGDRRRIARKGLTMCLGDIRHPDWDASRGRWEQWWDTHKDQLE